MQIAEIKRALRKTWRYSIIYGVQRTLYKVAGRLRLDGGRLLSGRRRQRTVAVIGCGQFSFATIGYFLDRIKAAGVASCYDLDTDAMKTFARFHSVPCLAHSADGAIAAPNVETVYIASNHASHTEYACKALRAGKTVFVEKPVAVSLHQLQELVSTVRTSNGRIYAGYNRPFSQACDAIREAVGEQTGPLTLSCFVSGHKLDKTHWYRCPEEGTRVCGNIGHWLDLAVHMLSWTTLPDCWSIVLAWSDDAARDDDLAICLTSERGDLVNIVMTARTEPFEGINETINLQWGDVIAKIDDFRRLTLWRGEALTQLRFRLKDVGHRRTIEQPFSVGRADRLQRDWTEVVLSSLLMLRVADMVRKRQDKLPFSFSEEMQSVGSGTYPPAEMDQVSMPV